MFLVQISFFPFFFKIHILNINPLSDALFGNTFSCSIACIGTSFTVLIDSFVVQEISVGVLIKWSRGLGYRDTEKENVV